MSFFTFDKNQSSNVIAPGNYEVFITECKHATFGSGAQGFKLSLTIRTDVEQAHGKQKLFENLVMGENTMFKFHQLLGALGFEDGTSFETEQAFQQAVLNQALRVKVINEPYNGETVARIRTFLPSQLGGEFVDTFDQPGNRDPFADPFADDGKPIDISEDELPF
jgi:hypothetical protein